MDEAINLLKECLVKSVTHNNYWVGNEDFEMPCNALLYILNSLTLRIEQTENKLSELLSYATGGRFSKVDYSIDDMRRFIDDYNQSTYDGRVGDD